MDFSDKNPPFWRNIILRAEPGRVDAELADNVHELRVTILHDKTKVTEVSGEAIRIPWVTCPAATTQLSALVGTPVEESTAPRIDQSHQCTHLLDLARLAIAHISRGGTQYINAAIRFEPDLDAAIATLTRNGELIVEWLARDGVVISEGPFKGHDTLRRSIWSPEVAADPELREAGLILRRCMLVFRTRNYSINKYSASDFDNMNGVCYSFLPEQLPDAVRPVGFHEITAR